MSTSTRSRVNGNGRAGKRKLVRVSRRLLNRIRHSPENQTLYGAVKRDDPEVIALAESIKKNGVQEPLVVTCDNYILSGHRRHTAASMAGLKTVPVRAHPIDREKQRDKFLKLLREFNRQRIKTREEKLREEVISVNPKEAHLRLLCHRQQRSRLEVEMMSGVETIALRGKNRRCKISEAKCPMLDAVGAILNEYWNYLPFTLRQIHYYLLNDPPLRHANKPDSVYCNNRASYQDLSNLLLRARLDGYMSWMVMCDETRPVEVWGVQPDVQTFLRDELEGFLRGYARDLMQSQPNHVEILGEKATIASIIQPVAEEYCIPMTLGRGFCSGLPRYRMAERFEESGKDRLVLLVLSDHDPDGEEIAHSFARSMRDDFHIRQIVPIKVALTAEQVSRFELPGDMTAKVTSANYRRFVEKHGNTVAELEALRPEQLQSILREAIDSVIDVEAFNDELGEEEQDAGFLEGVRRRVHDSLGDITNSD